jgi:molybdopterin molybdotransferase
LKLLVVDTLEAAREKMKRAIGDWTVESERVKISEAMVRVLSEDVFSRHPVPEFRRSSVDGYAVMAKDTQGAT